MAEANKPKKKKSGAKKQAGNEVDEVVAMSICEQFKDPSTGQDFFSID